jgi:uncharacterized membrane protein YgcG
MKSPAMVCLAATLLTSAGAWAGEPSGTVVAVIPASDASGATGTRMLVTRGPVYMGDRIHTGPRGEAQIELADNTRLVVGPNSSMVVDAFVFTGGGQAKQVALSAVRGAFRFITGDSRKSAYTITTPTATIGVRGTQFDFSIDRHGQLNFALFEGQARICSHTGRCTLLSGACSVAVVPSGGAIGRLPAGDARTRLLAANFPYIASQRSLRRGFRVDTSSCGMRRAEIMLPNGRTIFADLTAPDAIIPPPANPPPGAPPPGGPPPVTGSISNHSGLSDNTNPGQGSSHNNSSGGGSHNPGGSGGGNSGGVGSNAGGNGRGNGRNG